MPGKPASSTSLAERPLCASIRKESSGEASSRRKAAQRREAAERERTEREIVVEEIRRQGHEATA